LAKAIIAVPEAGRNKAFKIAEEEGIRHEFDNKRELANFWKNTCNAFA
jgi:glutamine phosphoribosylpyrophosphate amidotransferase